VTVAPLDWSAPGAPAAAAALAAGPAPAGLLLAADCVYIDPGEGGSPDADAFVRVLAAAAAAVDPPCPAWVALEERSAAALAAFQAAAARAFRSMRRVRPRAIVPSGGGGDGGGGGWALEHVHMYVLEL
jgi:hypothetical protein